MSKAGLYVHVPFCSSVCPYCDFAVTMAGEERRRAWERGVLAEARMYRDRGWRFGSVYFGGGTPSVLDHGQLEGVFAGLWETLDIAADRVCLEANPEDITVEKLNGWRDLGFNYLSLGVQSFDDDQLQYLGRKHTADGACRALESACAAGFRTVNVDLIFGLPGEGDVEWRHKLQTAVDIGVQHISCYQLTIHDGTVFGIRSRRGELAEAAEEDQAGLYLLAHDFLADQGFDGYEVSNFARPGHRSLHNMRYWTGDPYLGLGPGAHSFDGECERWWNRRKLRLWQRDSDNRRLPVEGREVLSREERILECLMLGTRLADGIDFADLEKRFGVDLQSRNREVLVELERQGLVDLNGPRLKPTIRGLAVADSIVRSLEVGTLSTTAG